MYLHELSFKQRRIGSGESADTNAVIWVWTRNSALDQGERHPQGVLDSNCPNAPLIGLIELLILVINSPRHGFRENPSARRLYFSYKYICTY